MPLVFLSSSWSFLRGVPLPCPCANIHFAVMTLIFHPSAHQPPIMTSNLEELLDISCLWLMFYLVDALSATSYCEPSKDLNLKKRDKSFFFLFGLCLIILAHINSFWCAKMISKNHLTIVQPISITSHYAHFESRRGQKHKKDLLMRLKFFWTCIGVNFDSGWGS